jgi:hypothetical protein
MRLCLFLLLATCAAFAQGGPPLLTDDPGTPGNGNWEINIAYTVERRLAEHEYEAPVLDINYGLGDRIQLKYQVPYLVRAENGSRARTGLGDSLFGVKWRFLENKKLDVDISTYPQLEINNPVSHSLDRGLVERGPGFLLPIEITKKLGPLDLNGEGGYWFQRGAHQRWIAGLAAGHQTTRRLELLSEIYSIGQDEGRDTTFDFGGRLQLFSSLNLIFMAGRSFRPVSTGEPSLIGYFGLQFLLPPRHQDQGPHSAHPAE